MHEENISTPEQLYQQGIQYFSRNDLKQGINCFKQAAQEDYSPAIKELGLCFLHGISLKQDLKQAVKYLKKSRSEAESQFELMKCYFFGYGVSQNLDTAKQLLLLSVQSRYIPAVNIMAMCYQIFGEINKAQSLFNLSHSNNDAFAKHLKQCNLIDGKEQTIDFIKTFQWPEVQNTQEKNILHDAPQIFSQDGLLSDIECEYIKYTASPFMRESMTVDPVTKQFVKDSVRTSYSATLDWLTEDPVVNLIMQKCCFQFDEPAENSEVMHVLHYSVGEEYKPHYDFFGGIQENDNFEPQQQRIKTICLYLNDVESGGATNFPNLNFKVMPKKGNAVFFENINLKNQQAYVESLHAGEPVIKGEKWLATLWIRNSKTNRGPDYE